VGADAHTSALLSAARPAGMRTLWESGLERVWNGITSLDELVRVLGERAGEDPGLQETEAPGEEVAAPRPARPSGGTPSPTAAGGAPATKTRILVADDDRQMRRLVRMVLERDGHEVTEAADGLDA